MQALKAFFFFELFCTSTSQNPRAEQIAEEYFKHYFRQINQVLLIYFTGIFVSC